MVLVVAGRDPTGGAGVDADREAILAAGCAARCVVAAETDQDGVRVRAVRPRDPGAWLAEARAELAARPAALKSGLLPGAEHVRALARLKDELGPIPAVVDPVLAASGGERFLDAAGVAALLDLLLPRGVVLTPNLPEAAELAGVDEERLAADPAARLAAARALLARGAAAIVLKGGHGREDPAADLVLAREPAEPVWIQRARVPGLRLHGSGCRFASGLAAGLARGLPLADAARAAGDRVAALVRARGVPRGG